MPIFLDDKQVELTGTDLAGVLATAKERLEPTGRVVVEVELDGQNLSNTEIEQHHATEVAQKEVRLYSADPRELISSTLKQVRGRLGEARTLQEEAAELLQQDNVADALQRVSVLVEIWLQTQQAVAHSATLMGIQLDDLQVDGQPVTSLTTELIERLQMLKELLGSQDTVALADTLAYEWPETLTRWDSLVERLIEEVENR